MKLLGLVIAASAARAWRDWAVVGYRRGWLSWREYSAACRGATSAQLALLEASCRARAGRGEA